MKSPDRHLPPPLLGNRIDTIVGLECNIYFEALSLRCLAEDWELTVTCELGRQMADRWTLLAEPSQKGKHAFSISYRDPHSGHLVSASCDLYVHETFAFTRPYSWLPIGDSITGAGGYVKALGEHARLHGLEVTPLGTRALHSDPTWKHEGYPGWRFVDFLQRRTALTGANFYDDTSSPFLFPTTTGGQFDFERYLREHLADREPDFLTLFLGVNDIALLNDDTLEDGIATSLRHAETLVEGILHATKNTVIGIVPPLTPGSQDAFGTNYGCLIPRWRYRKNQHAMVRAIQNLSRKWPSRVSVVPAYLSIDPQSGYPSREENIHAHSDQTRTIASNAVHPCEAGHRQIADAIFAWMAGRLS